MVRNLLLTLVFNNNKDDSFWGSRPQDGCGSAGFTVLPGGKAMLLQYTGLE